MPRIKRPFYVYPREIPRENGKKNIVYYYCINTPSGLPPDVCAKEQRKSTGMKSKGKAEQWILQERIPQLQAEVKHREEDEVIANLPPTLGEWLTPFYLPGFCPHLARLESDGKPVTYRWANDQRGRLDRLVVEDPIAKIPVAELTPGHIEDWKKRRRLKGNGPRTINLTLSALKACFAEGLHRGELSYNPTQVVGKIREETKAHGIYSMPELRRIFLDEPELWDYPENYHGNAEGVVSNLMVYTFAFLFATTGERPRALLQLKWVDVGDGEISFRPEILKTSAARTIPLISRVKDLLEELRDDGVRVADDDWVFGYSSGDPLQYTWYRKAWERMMTTAKLPEIDTEGLKRVPYSLKHSLVTHLIDEGADPVFVREYVGHSHGTGIEPRRLTRVQARYKRRQAEKLKTEVLPFVERIFG